MARIQAQKSARGYRALAEAVQISSPIVQTHSSQHESKAGRSTCPLATPLIGDSDRLVPLFLQGSLHHLEVKKRNNEAVVDELKHDSSSHPQSRTTQRYILSGMPVIILPSCIVLCLVAMSQFVSNAYMFTSQVFKDVAAEFVWTLATCVSRC